MTRRRTGTGMTRRRTGKRRTPEEIYAEQAAIQHIIQAKTAINNARIPGCAVVEHMGSRATDTGSASGSGSGSGSGSRADIHLSDNQLGHGRMFDIKYPNTLDGVISCDEFAASLERINNAGKVPGKIPHSLFSIGFLLAIGFLMTAFFGMAGRHLELFKIFIGVGSAGACICCCSGSYISYQRRQSVVRQRAAISAENDRYTSSERAIPCTWKAQTYRGTAQVLYYGSFTQLEISSGAGFGSSISAIVATYALEPVDEIGRPRNPPQMGIFIPGPPVVTANTALVPGQGYGYGAYGTMAPTAPLAIPAPEADAPVMATDGMKATLLPPSYSDSWQDSSASASCPAPILLTKPAYKSMPATAATATATNSSASVTIPIANPSIDSLVCAQCSTQLPRNSIFCSQCGARVGI